MNPNIKAKYLDNPNQCPHCDSENLSVESGLDFSGNQCWRTVSCVMCGKMWREIFTVTDIEEIS